MRLFVAVELEEAARAAAAAASRTLRRRIQRRADLDARWVPDENLHLTLWFLGEVRDDRVSSLYGALEAPLTVAPFLLELSGFGAFPPRGAPRVLWMGVRRGGESMAALHAAVGERVIPLGFEPEKRAYAAHLTLARIREPGRGGAGASAARNALETAVVPIPSAVTHVTLFRSRLSPKGASYEPTLRVPLTG